MPPPTSQLCECSCQFPIIKHLSSIIANASHNPVMPTLDLHVAFVWSEEDQSPLVTRTAIWTLLQPTVSPLPTGTPVRLVFDSRQLKDLRYDVDRVRFEGEIAGRRASVDWLEEIVVRNNLPGQYLTLAIVRALRSPNQPRHHDFAQELFRRLLVLNIKAEKKRARRGIPNADVPRRPPRPSLRGVDHKPQDGGSSHPSPIDINAPASSSRHGEPCAMTSSAHPNDSRPGPSRLPGEPGHGGDDVREVAGFPMLPGSLSGVYWPKQRDANAQSAA
ncbi:hypothetical protein BD413DRAFT_494531 [Trametes elegans]|nr:hypothetical protein BD413DRAFT_494531 [Trametes elegans]